MGGIMSKLLLGIAIVSIGSFFGNIMYEQWDDSDMSFEKVSDITSQPDVWFSYTSGDCVKVINYKKQDNYTCQQLPKNFYHIWVE